MKIQTTQIIQIDQKEESKQQTHKGEGNSLLEFSSKKTFILAKARY